MVVEPKILNNICITAHPLGCAKEVENQIFISEFFSIRELSSEACVEISNTSGKTINLNNYVFNVFWNGQNTVSLNLSGELENNDSIIIKNNSFDELEDYDYVLDGETYYTYDFNDIMVMCSFLYMSPDYIDKMTFEILDNDALHITFYSRDYLTDEETGTLLDSYEYNLYAEVEIRDVGTTTLPADGVYPTLLK